MDPAQAARPDGSSPPELLKIGDFARLADTNLRTLRYYEELGLLEPAMRSRGGFRYYRRTDINRMRLIRDLQELGLALERVHELLGSRAETPDRKALLARVRRALEEHGRLLDERIALIEAQKARVAEAAAKLSECATCCDCTPGPANNYCEPCPRSGSSLPGELSALF